MKDIAYLITAYTEPETLKNLIETLNDERVDFYIHIDKKVDDSQFVDSLKEYKNVFFIPKNLRVKIYWGGYSQVVMQKNLIKYMIDSDTEYKRVVSITGTDYPVVSKEELFKRLLDIETEYIYGFDITHEEYKKNDRRPPHKGRFTYFYMYDSNKYIRGIFNKFKIKRSKKYRNLDFNLYYGSEYWALTYNTLKDIIKEYEKNIKLQKLLRHAFAPSESWIHTTYFNMPNHKGTKYSDWEHRELHMLSPVTYFCYKGYVKVLNEEDLDNIIASRKMFARKIIVGKSDRLINTLKEENN